MNLLFAFVVIWFALFLLASITFLNSFTCSTNSLWKSTSGTGMDKDKMRRIFSGKMNGYEYTIMCNAVLTDSEYSDSPKKRG